MVQITGGKVSYSRTVQAAQYEPKKADVEFTFVLPEGATLEDAAAGVKHASDLAVAKVNEILGIAKPAAKAVPSSPAPATKEKAKAADKPKAVEPEPEIRKSPEDRKEPEADDPFAEPEAKAADPIDDILGEAAPLEITDKDLQDAITKKNAEIANAVAIRTLVGEFVKHPKTYKDIAQNDRSTFLKKLSLLKK